MRFTCSKKDIYEKLNLVIKSITNRTTMPILKGILIEAKEEKILIKGIDLEISILSKLKIKNDEVGTNRARRLAVLVYRVVDVQHFSVTL